MNYIQEINDFYTWLETNPLTPQEISLWFALMQVCNKTRWRQEFCAAMSVLVIKAGGSRRAVERAREGLARKGRIIWRKQPGRQAAVYIIISFGGQNHLVRQNDSGLGAQDVVISKQDKTKQVYTSDGYLDLAQVARGEVYQ